MTHLLDTGTCIHFMLGQSAVCAAVARLSPEDCGISAITSHELYLGVEKCEQPEQEKRKISLLLQKVTALDFNEASALAAAEIRAALEATGRGIGPYDTLIAGQARARGLTLVTTNTREFSRVANLRVEDWTKSY